MDEKSIEDLLRAIYAVAKAAEPTLLELIVIPLMAGFIGALSAFLFSMRQVNLVSIRESRERVAREICSCINDLQCQSVEYWSKDYNREKISESEIAEAQIHADIILLASLIPQFISMNMSTVDRVKATSILNSFYDEAYDLATGGEFESAERKASKQRVKQICNLCVKTRADLSCFC